MASAAFQSVSSKRVQSRAARSQRGSTVSRAAAAPPAPGFKQLQRFVVPDEVETQFRSEWTARQSHMSTMDGFQGFDIKQQGEEFVVESSWASIPAWEAYSLSKPARRSHLPWGIFQRVPKTGEGFPEDFVPFVDMATSVNARYPPAPKAAKPAATNGGPKAASAPKAPSKEAVPAAGFTQCQRFIVPKDVQHLFQAEWEARQRHMSTMPGFLGLSIDWQGQEFTIKSSWKSIPEWEAYSLSKEARRSHLPWGIYQRVPKVGEGFPEDFVPFVDMNSPSLARYPAASKA